jgi:asparagine synthase (glutamine-hydrolysing)
MRFSIENRVPFLTQGLAQLLLSLPEEYLISGNGETKNVLRAALRGIVPDAVLQRRDKIGFETPEHDWLRSLSVQARAWISETDGIPFINKPQLLNRFDAVMAGRQPFDWQVWRWINFIRWFQLENIRT